MDVKNKGFRQYGKVYLYVLYRLETYRNGRLIVRTYGIIILIPYRIEQLLYVRRYIDWQAWSYL